MVTFWFKSSDLCQCKSSLLEFLIGNLAQFFYLRNFFKETLKYSYFGTKFLIPWEFTNTVQAADFK